MLRSMASRLAFLEAMQARVIGPPVVVYPAPGECPKETLQRYGYRPEILGGRPILWVTYAAPLPEDPD